jgi:predicted NBD/HSP70 family sugar kinase
MTMRRQPRSGCGLCVTWLQGSTSIINALDPEVIIIGGGIAQPGPALFDPLADFMESIEWRPQGHRVHIIPAALGELAHSGLLTTLSIAA